VAYVRFASVYKDFSDVDSFIQIISELDIDR
jgi:transcriptional repressor NrdR